MKTAVITHIGNVRAINEDSTLLSCEKRPFFLLVADGMGGHAAGEVASNTACCLVQSYIESLETETLTEQQLVDAVIHANKGIIQKTRDDHSLKGMGTTLTLAYAEDDRLMIAQVGDSRAYLFHGGVLEQVTNDHTYVQYLLDNGVLSEKSGEEYPFKNIITRALGMRELKVDTFTVEWADEDILMLCSDGITAYLSSGDIASILSNGKPLKQKAQEMVDFALAAGGKDNISVVLAQNSLREDGAI
ncbi:MAG: Stp1/IreP family PP2C-type Ser/Thr phosphatase [Christensenellaceae bacterium]|jgi:serine/threonine protein phosphatase PrpC